MELLFKKHLAEKLGVAESTALRYLMRGQIKPGVGTVMTTLKVGRNRAVRREVLEDHLRSMEGNGDSPDVP